MSEILFIYNNQQRRDDVAAALGGEVWYDEHHLHWRPDGEDTHVSVPWRDLAEPFNPDEWVVLLRYSWAKAGARL